MLCAARKYAAKGRKFMPLIELTTHIAAPIQRCFDLARSIDFHITTAGKTGETAIAGRMTGLIGLDETVTWRAKHLGVWQKLTSKITALERPKHFRDEMIKGAFASLCHDHYFEEEAGGTAMHDNFTFESPLGPLGMLANWLFLEAYLRQFIVERNALLKATAESEGWRAFLAPKQ